MSETISSKVSRPSIRLRTAFPVRSLALGDSAADRIGPQRPGLSCGGRGGGGTLVRKNISARRLAPGVALGFRSPQEAISKLIRLVTPGLIRSRVLASSD